MACRRRETSGTNASIFCYIFSFLFFLLLLLLLFGTFVSLAATSKTKGCCFQSRAMIQLAKSGDYRSGKQIKPDPVSRDDVAAKIWGLYRSGKQTTPDPALRPSSRHKSTKNRRPLPPPSTLTPTPPAPARRPMPSTMTPANPPNPPCPSLPSTGTPASTPMYEQPAALGSPRSVSKFVQRLALNNRTPAMASNVVIATTAVSNRNSRYRRPPSSMKGMTTRETLITQMDSSFGMGLSAAGPIRILPRPVSDLIGLAQVSSWPRSVYFNYLENPSLSSSPYFVELGRRLQTHIVLTSMVSLVIYLATKTWSSLGKPPIHLIGIAEDIISLTKSFKALSFRFISRSENLIADDLAKKALRSMTSGPTCTM